MKKIFKKILFYKNFKSDAYKHIERLYAKLEYKDQQLYELKKELESAAFAEIEISFDLLNERLKTDDERDVIIFHQLKNFHGNAKYLYLYYLNKLKENNSNLDIYWLTEDLSVLNRMKELGLPVLLWKGSNTSVETLKKIIKVKFYFCNEYFTFRPSSYLLFKLIKNSMKVNLWHGIGSKRVNYSTRKSSYGAYDYAMRQYFNEATDLFLDPSDNYLLKQDFEGQKFINFPYPRLLEFIDSSIAESTYESEILEWQKDPRFKILYAPTWLNRYQSEAKDTVYNSIDEILNVAQLSEQENILVGIKLHKGFEDTKSLREKLNGYDNVLLFHNDSDSQPILRTTDVLITDYSSIYTDFLYLDRPVIFLDLHREIYENSVELTLKGSNAPGIVIDNLRDLSIEVLLDRQENLKSKRAEVFKINFGEKPNYYDYEKWIDLLDTRR